MIRRTANGGIAAATNDALAVATGMYCALLDHDDTLAPDALLTIVEAIIRAPDAAMLFCDEDKLDARGRAGPGEAGVLHHDVHSTPARRRVFDLHLRGDTTDAGDRGRRRCWAW